MPKTDYPKEILSFLFNNGPATRTEIAETMDVRKGTVGQVVGELIDKGKLEEIDEDKKRNARLKVKPESFLSIGVEHRVDKLIVVLLNVELKVLHKEICLIENLEMTERVHFIASTLHSMIDEAGVEKESILGIGFSDFVPHDIGTGLKTKSIWMPGWGDINIKRSIEEEVGVETYVVRCTDAHSFAESVFGACVGVKKFITAQLDAGIGMSIFSNGNFFTGTTDIFGELGHTVYKDDGEICKCGNRGCLETIAGVNAIVRKVEDNIKNGVAFPNESGGEITLTKIIQNAKEGNKLSLLVLNEASKAIGDILANVVNVLGVSRILLYGRLTAAGEILLNQLYDSLRKHCIYPLNQDVIVTISPLDEYASAMGAAYMLISRYFNTATAKSC